MEEHISRSTDPLWYKDAVIYQLHVKTFFDGNADGYGDFTGLIEKLDYIQDLGIDCLWLLPFYPSPLKDDGYDIADYRGINRIYGDSREFRRFIKEAHRRGVRVITELVVNHTSDQHPWFQAARKAPPGSLKRDYYVWSQSDQKYKDARIIFIDSESSNWTWDPVAKAFYWHRFFYHQPDLNFDNQHVRQAVIRIMRYWLDMGVDGLRLDAVPYLIEREGTSCENIPETHQVLKEWRRVIDEHYEGRILLAEANQWPADVVHYFGSDDECHMAFNFPLMPRLFMALHQEDRHPITDIIEQIPLIPDNCQWAIFLRNHDELTLEMVTDTERDYMYRAYAEDLMMRINVGIRRRLAPLLQYSRRRIELMNGLLLSLPGSPVIYYGDEIGMGENIFLGDRNSVRTPMQWNGDRNGGFSKAQFARLYAPPNMDPVTGYQAINVEQQSLDPSSLLHWMKNIIRVRKEHRVFGRGSITLLKPENRKILAFIRHHEGKSILVIANLSRYPQAAKLDLAPWAGIAPIEMFGLDRFPEITEAPYMVALGAHSFYWFMLQADESRISVPFSLSAQKEESKLVLPYAHQGDCWTYSVDELRRFFERATAHMYMLPSLTEQPASISERVKSALPLEIEGLMGIYIREVGLMAGRSAEFHKQLAKTDLASGANLTPEQIDSLSAKAATVAKTTLRQLAEKQAELDPQFRENIGLILENGHIIVSAVDLSGNLQASVPHAPCDGNFTLGRLFRVAADFSVACSINGQVAAPYEKGTVLWDLATILRSFAYATYTSLFMVTHNRPADVAQLLPWAAICQNWLIAIFLKQYLADMQESCLLPACEQDLFAALHSFMLERACQELLFELNERPSWLPVALFSLRQLLVGESFKLGDRIIS